jgi:hypothetical protein
MAVIDAKTGARAGLVPLPEGLKPIINQETDRIYFYTDAGLLQCLHERQLAQPHRYEPPKGDAKPAEPGADPFKPGDPAATPPAETTPPPGNDPFAPMGDAPAPGDSTAEPMAEGTAP